MSLNIDMKIIRPLNSFWLIAHFGHELLDFADELQCGNRGKYSTRIPSVLRQLCPKFCIVVNL